VKRKVKFKNLELVSVQQLQSSNNGCKSQQPVI